MKMQKPHLFPCIRFSFAKLVILKACPWRLFNFYSIFTFQFIFLSFHTTWSLWTNSAPPFFFLSCSSVSLLSLLTHLYIQLGHFIFPPAVLQPLLPRLLLGLCRFSGQLMTDNIHSLTDLFYSFAAVFFPFFFSSFIPHSTYLLPFFRLFRHNCNHFSYVLVDTFIWPALFFLIGLLLVFSALSSFYFLFYFIYFFCCLAGWVMF